MKTKEGGVVKKHRIGKSATLMEGKATKAK